MYTLERRGFLGSLAAWVAAGVNVGRAERSESRQSSDNGIASSNEQVVGLASLGPPYAEQGHPVPMLHVTDLFRPHNDPDDHWDLACVYALARQGRVDLKGVLIDYPQGDRRNDPDVLAIAQLNYLTGLAVPVMVGSPRPISRDEAAGKDAALALGGIRSLLQILRESPQPVAITVTGTCRDVALAAMLEPKTFASKCVGVYINAGSGTPDPAKAAHLEWNVRLDAAAYAAMFDLPCPVYWLPCFEEVRSVPREPPKVAEYGTFYRFRQDEVLPHLSDAVQNFFAFMYRDGRQENKDGAARADWLRYLLGPKDQELLARQGKLFRNMWSTAGFLHPVGLTVSSQGQIVRLDEAADPIYTFDPVKVQCNEQGITRWSVDPGSKDRFLFHVRDTANYQTAMTAALRALVRTLP